MVSPTGGLVTWARIFSSQDPNLLPYPGVNNSFLCGGMKMGNMDWREL